MTHKKKQRVPKQAMPEQSVPEPPMTRNIKQRIERHKQLRHDTFLEFLTENSAAVTDAIEFLRIVRQTDVLFHTIPVEQRDEVLTKTFPQYEDKLVSLRQE